MKLNHFPYPLIDIGVNLTSSRLFKRREDILARSLQAGVVGLVLTGTDLKNSKQLIHYTDERSSVNLKQAENLKNIEMSKELYLWSTAGVHPHDAQSTVEQSKLSQSWLEELRTLLMNDRVIAVGECGLDYDRNYSEPAIQRKVFEAQLKLAVETQKPLFLHQRAAGADFVEMLKDYADELPKRGDQLAAVVHCFTDDLNTMEKLLELGTFIGITGWICDERRGESLQKAVAHLPLQSVLVETDAPYLLPRTLKPKPKKGYNEPAYLPHIVEHLSQYMAQDVSVVAQASFENTKRLFHLELQ